MPKAPLSGGVLFLKFLPLLWRQGFCTTTVFSAVFVLFRTGYTWNLLHEVLFW